MKLLWKDGRIFVGGWTTKVSCKSMTIIIMNIGEEVNKIL